MDVHPLGSSKQHGLDAMIEWRIWRRGAKSQQVKFVHHSTTANIGDILTSPRHYFNFKSNVGTLAIVGGGAFDEPGMARVSQEPADTRILWGVGRSVRDGAPAMPFDYGQVSKFYALMSTRDPEDAVHGVRLVPCVSALHPICDMPPGRETGLILNANADVSSAAVAEFISAHRGPAAHNEVSEEAYIDAFSRMGLIITNSYHAAYWGLLSGRSVVLLGYSSKFVSLFRLLQLDPAKIVTYARNGGEDFARALDMAYDVGSRRVGLPDGMATKIEFRAINYRFAEEITNRGLAQVVPRHLDPIEL